MSSAGRSATAAYIGPFVVFVGVMALEHTLLPNSQVLYPVRFIAALAAILYFWWGRLDLRPSQPLASIAIGLAVFVIWVAPDRLFHYRHFWLFDNSIVGSASSSIPANLQITFWFLLVRTLGSVVLVPILEELFWRGWLMRWLINQDFEKVPLGTYAPYAFWLTAVLFASEHGPYWEVGLAAGVIYNWWLIRTKTLADCILAHAVTNGVLAAYVMVGEHWQYWL